MCLALVDYMMGESMEPIDTFISTGISLRKVPDSFVYTDFAYMFFTMPDVPEFTYNPMNITCKMRNSTSPQDDTTYANVLRKCIIHEDIHLVNQETSNLLRTAQNVFTIAGISKTKRNTSSRPLPAGKMDMYDPSSTDIENAGKEWYKEVRTLILNRGKYSL
jgi:hypothetical protein